ncbi:hypothetical protein CEUSTIGMA_g11576.t1 [Chlamydomonas eustigma]|uniref:ACT domain-containing protein n=1 Tax=Chlamydomonas eustigma TaxID=1157962 RepID=A0A250XM99_9CHLO|nr:hypothetical protein CEUSTIGMA_g11576.t1 [Chlamydomonas eustigma]|eukprot:GAX84153.1 hypothetical protein CEUSTIGMA_g11576.t1 [Chlamydomonas eustigma]
MAMLKTSHKVLSCAQTTSRRKVAACSMPLSSRSSRTYMLLDFAPTCPLNRARGRKILCRSSSATEECVVPAIKIDNIHDPFATVVTVDMGDEISEMLETILALKNIGLNIRRAKISQKEKSAASSQNVFYLTEASTSEKIVKSARLEEIRMTVITSIMSKFPQNCESFSVSAKSSSDSSEGKPLLGRSTGTARAVVPTSIEVTEAENGSCSVLKIKTADRPGLLVDIVRVLKDVNLNVVSAEVDTVGTEAQDEFFLTYRGEPLSTPMITLVSNALQYYLSLGEISREESY